MTEQEVLEGNRLLAFFDGGILKKVPTTDFQYFTHEDMCHVLFEDVYPEDLQYHSSWDWLVGIIEKIRLFELVNSDMQKLPIRIEIGFDDGPVYGNHCHIESYGVGHGYLPQFHVNNQENSLTATYKCVIQFIKWYNNEKDRHGGRP